MTNRDRAYSVDNGLVIDENSGGPFYTGGSTSPIGSVSAQPGDFYIQNTPTKPIIFMCTGTGVNDWRQIEVADLVNILSLETHTSTLNGTDLLNVNSVTLHRIIGTATGYSVQLPDASTLKPGRRFEISNESSETILLKDGSGTTLFSIVAGSFATATLETDGSAAGNWIITIIGSAATGILSYVITSGTVFSTTSTTDIAITGFSITPVSGRYAVWYSSDITIASNNRIAQCVVYVAGSPVENTSRDNQGTGSNYVGSQNTVGEIAVNGSQSVDVRVNIDAGSLSVNQRSLVLIRLGN